MPWNPSLSIKNKIILIIVSATILTTFIGFSIRLIEYIYTYKKELIAETTAQTKVLSEYCLSPLVLNNSKEATDILNKLNIFNNILVTEIYDKSGHIFVRHTNSKEAIPRINFKGSNSRVYSKYYLHLKLPIIKQQNNYGYIYVIASTEKYREHIKEYIITMSIILVFLTLLSFIIANWLQKYISRPILKLAEFAREQSKVSDYSKRIQKISNDETGELYDALNNMLSFINIREKQRETANKQLKESETKNRVLLQAIPDLMFVLDKEGNYIDFKSNENSLLAIPPEEIIGKNLTDVGFTDYQLRQIRYLCELGLKTKKVQTFNYDLNVPAGHKYFEARLIAIDDTRIMGIVRDISEQKETEQQLEKEKIKTTAAEEADKLKSAFLANMSHEIRTPMNAIIGFSNLLRDDNINHKEKIDYIDIINKSSDQLIHLIDDIIDISKIEAGQLVIKKTKCYINEILKEIYIFFDNDKKNKGKTNVSLCLNTPENSDELFINTDLYRFKQIFTNLLSNAFKFTETGIIEFGYNYTKEDKFITFYVKDSGIGIQEDKLSEIFDRFRKIEDKRIKLYGGAGLGLAITKNLVETMGGNIRAESIRQKGSVFYFNLPAIIPVTQSQLKNQPAIIQDSMASYKWKGKKILVVEDEDFVIKFINKCITPTGAELVFVKNGFAAVKSFREQSDISLILMDIKLPELNGFEAVKRIRQINIKIPIAS
ncbi:MAG: response regulator [Bacteroidales bacterium]|nr:response regulator [Bacteroidales bacterium]